MVVKYYAQRTFQKLRQDHLSYLWDRKGKAKKYKGMDRSDSFRWLEWSIMFLSEFFHQEQLTIDLYVESELDHLADEVIELLKKKNPTHPLFGVTRDQLRQWNLIGFVANKFDDQATREILDCQCELFEKLEFEVDNENEKDLIDIYEVITFKTSNVKSFISQHTILFVLGPRQQKRRLASDFHHFHGSRAQTWRLLPVGEQRM